MKRSGTHAILEWIASMYKSWEIFGACTYDDVSEFPDAHRRQGSKPEVIIHAFEDKWVDVVRPDYVVVRDFRTMWASRMCNVQYRRFMQAEPDTVSKWVDHARFAKEFPGRAILFDEWVRSIVYQAEITIRFGLRGGGDTTRVSPRGGGSSFDGLAFDGRAHQMNVLTRYEAYPTPYPCDEVRELNEELFG
jgi:hypothetical protein